MLVLSRKKEEKIVIGDGEIVITITAIYGDTVRLGFEARKGVPIHRLEVFREIQKERKNRASLAQSEEKT